MHDHDQRFKTLIQEFFGEFLQLFFAPWEERFDCGAVEWLDKEVFPDPPQGERRILDLVAKLPTRQAVMGLAAGEPDHLLALVHIEIESPDRARPLRQRMYQYYGHLRIKYQLPVLPIGVFLQVGLDGLGIDVYEEQFWELQTVRFQYLYVGLPALDAVEYVQGENWLGVALAALMKIPKDRAAWLGAEALRRLQEAPLSDQRRFLLGECVHAYLPLDEEQQRQFEHLLGTESYQGAKAMNVTPYEKVIEKGIEKGIDMGIEKGHRDALREQLKEKFGLVPTPVLQRLEQLPPETIMELLKKIIRVQSLNDLGLN